MTRSVFGDGAAAAYDDGDVDYHLPSNLNQVITVSLVNIQNTGIYIKSMHFVHRFVYNFNV